MCGTLLDKAGNAGFTGCYYSIRGMKREDDKEERVERLNLVAPNSRLLTFKDGGDEEVEWIYLTIETRPYYG